jgi:hypothetical protein
MKNNNKLKTCYLNSVILNDKLIFILSYNIILILNE